MGGRGCYRFTAEPSDDDPKRHIRAARGRSDGAGGAAGALVPSSVRNASREVMDLENLFDGGFVPTRLLTRLPRASAVAVAPPALMPPPVTRTPRAGDCWLVAVGVKDDDGRVLHEGGDELVPGDKYFV